MNKAINNPAQVFLYSDFVDKIKKDAELDHLCKLNFQRIKRIEKQTSLKEEFLIIRENFNPSWNWILIVEPWCSDGAQSIPIIKKITELFSNINLKIILRDENPEIMMQYLTNGKRSIPKLICIDKIKGKELWTWGPTSKAAQKEIERIRIAHAELTKQEHAKKMSLWYAINKGIAIQDDFIKIFKLWSKK